MKVWENKKMLWEHELQAFVHLLWVFFLNYHNISDKSCMELHCSFTNYPYTSLY